MSKMTVTKAKLEDLASSIKNKAGVSTELTLDEMKTAVENIPQGGGSDDDYAYLICTNGAILPSTINMHARETASTIRSSCMANNILPHNSNYTFDNFTYTSSTFQNTKSNNDGIVKNHNIINLTGDIVTIVNNMFSSSEFTTINLHSNTKTNGSATSIANLMPYLRKLSITKFAIPYSATSVITGSGTDEEGIDVIIESFVDDTTQASIQTGFNGNSSTVNKINSFVIKSDTKQLVLRSVSAFNYTWIATEENKGYIYVPDSLVDTYKSATNWLSYADKIRPLSEYVERED